MGSDFTTTPGGKGANQAVAVARLGYPVQMIGALGHDGFGDSLLHNLQQKGVNTEGIIRVPGAFPASRSSPSPVTVPTPSSSYPAQMPW